MEAVEWERRPKLRRPVLVAAFEGWSDAGDAASTAAKYLAAAWGARRFAVIDSEDFYDYTSTRPQVRLVEGGIRQIDWPTNEFAAASLPGGKRDVIFLHGVEPQLKWKTFCAAVLDVAHSLDAEMALTLGALLTDTPHSRPVRVTGTATDPELGARLGLQRSRYEGPTGITGVLHDALTRGNIPSASLWASVPHYVSQVPSPKATLALVERAAEMLGGSVEVTDLQIAAAAYERSVDERVEADDEAAAYVRQLEEAAEEEERDEEDDAPIEPPDLPSRDALAAEVERFLREHRRGD